MNPLQINAGLVAGAIGALLWAAIAYYAQVEIGYIAWGIGGLVGVAVAVTGKNSKIAGAGTVLITILSLIVGKYAAVEFAVQEIQAGLEGDGFDEAGEAANVTDDVLKSLLGQQIAKQRAANGQEIQWPDIAEDEQSIAAQFPADIWREAEQQFAEKTDEEKAAMRESHVANIRKMMAEIRAAMVDAMREDGFWASFSAMDVLFFGLAIVTAWSIASREEENTNDEFAAAEGRDENEGDE